MNKLTWSDKVTDKNNPWFLAIDLEDSGRYADAAEFYINSAISSWQNGSYVRTALSCSCAANCLEKLSNLNLAIQLYYESASIYESHSLHIINKSIREAIWSLQRAYQGYLQAQRKDKAEEILGKYESLIAKVNLYSSIDTVASMTPITKESIQYTQMENSSNNHNTSAVSEQLTQHIEFFFKIRSSGTHVSQDNNGESEGFHHLVKRQSNIGLNLTH